MAMKYKDYFEVDKSYFPCIDEDAINAGAEWQDTYPHETFIKLLDEAINMLDGSTKRSLWIYGAFGTGKSKCAYALRKILDSRTPDEEVTKYWNKYDSLKSRPNLLEKIRGHRDKKIVTVFKYTVSTKSNIEGFLTDIQESIREALIDNGCSYLGQNTQKDAVIKWLEGSERNKAYIDSCLSESKWRTLFAESSADEILDALKNNRDVTCLMDNLSKLSEENQINAFLLDANILVKWIRDVVNKNNIKMIFVWDEFSDFFKRFSGYIAEFQEIVQICQSTPFYFVIVTHPISSLGVEDESAKIVRQRFTSIEIQLPDNVAFDLIGDAIRVENDAKDKWWNISRDLMDSVRRSTEAICKSMKIERDAIMRMLPIHPMTALALKNIATAFQSNQRSMFDFIKSNSRDSNEQSFQWFISKYGPDDSFNNLLTVDMLWDYIYERGNEYLSSQIKSILDVYYQQSGLNEYESRVLKTILIFNAISTRLGGALDILRPTDRNISFCYEGIDRYETIAKNTAKGLADKGILFSRKLNDGSSEYLVAVYAGDNDKIEKNKEDIRKIVTIDYLVREGTQISQAIGLTQPLKLRFADINTGSLKVVTKNSFIAVVDDMFRNQYTYNFRCVLAVAKSDEEAAEFRTLIKDTVKKETYRGLIVIDALSAPFGMQNLEDYIDFQAMSQYYHGNNFQQEKEYSKKAKDVLDIVWARSIHDCQFSLFSYDFQNGNRCNCLELRQILESIVKDRFPNVLDFGHGLNENQLKDSALKQSAKCGLEQDARGVVRHCEEIVLDKVWNVDNYWNNSQLQGLSIVKIKNGVDEYIRGEFDKGGDVEIGAVYSYLQTVQGFPPCNLSAFVFGFLLKEYSVDPYRFMNSDGKIEQISSEKLAEMIESCMKANHKDMFIVKITSEERDFYDVTEKIWDVRATQCAFPSAAATLVCDKIRNLGYPIWCLEESNNPALYNLLNLYIVFIKASGQDQYKIALEIGKTAKSRPAYMEDLHDILTEESCKSAMEAFLKSYNDGRLLSLAKELSAVDLLYADIRSIFGDSEFSALWDKETGLREINKLTVKYNVIKTSNDILGAPHSVNIEGAYAAWTRKFKFMGLSCDGLKSMYPELNGILDLFREAMDDSRIFSEKIMELNDGLIDYKDELRKIVGDSLSVFRDLYTECLGEFTDVEIEDIQKTINENLFPLSKAQSFSIVSAAAKSYSSSLTRNKLKDMWINLTDSKSPIDWSNIHRTPILRVVSASLYEDAKKAFETVNSIAQSRIVNDADIEEAIGFMEGNSGLFDGMKNQDFVDECFRNEIVGEYSVMLPDLNFVRDKLSGLGIDVYSWSDNPEIKSLVKDLARGEYENGGRERILKDINNMSDSELKKKICDLVSSDMEFGLKIMKDGDI